MAATAFYFATVKLRMYSNEKLLPIKYIVKLFSPQLDKSKNKSTNLHLMTFFIETKLISH